MCQALRLCNLPSKCLCDDFILLIRFFLKKKNLDCSRKKNKNFNFFGLKISLISSTKWHVPKKDGHSQRLVTYRCVWEPWSKEFFFISLVRYIKSTVLPLLNLKTVRLCVFFKEKNFWTVDGVSSKEVKEGEKGKK